MIVFIARRLVISFFVLLAATFIIFVLTALSGDPLEDLRQDASPQKALKIADRVERMQLDLPVLLRYVGWLGRVARGDLGVNRDGQDVATLLGDSLSSTLQLVLAATVLAITVGIVIGIVSALRQYSGFDYTVTFAAFVCFSLPLFWVAVMLKQYVAIEFNNWLKDPNIPPMVIGLLALLGGLTFGALTMGERRRRLIGFAVGLVVSGTLFTILSVTRWFADPGLGTPLILAFGLAAAVGFTVLSAGLQYRGPLYAALGAALIGALSSQVLGSALTDPTWLEIGGLLLLTIAVCVGLGYAFGGLQRQQAITATVLTGVFTGGMVFLDRMLQAFATFTTTVRGRPISTIGARTPNYSGDFWQLNLDSAGHLLLPTMALILISLATYTRYSRASMLEVMNQDYVRTARAKGLPERTVVVKHAFRNGLIPITTLMAFDLAGVIGGAVVTENVFGWRGMGFMFTKGLQEVDPGPVMAFFLVTGTTIVVFNMLADILYAYLDPRIRLS
ncbi:ABC transporter permease [Streptosporangium sp. NBC_01756]|uniref:ABC transporter permease n=1 Tax=Streptosporangium sp. NBC_01756 TaxID=2975950 RepID=UPI002DDA6967|nr:ABC transporter permease [Streptosporangium sp. NBC_01756]WSC88109.1 ABC transporter permease [Streptosporangium sp. NBC_01756]